MRVAAAAADHAAARGADPPTRAQLERILSQSRLHHQVPDAGCGEDEGEGVRHHLSVYGAAARADARGSTTRAAADRIRVCTAPSWIDRHVRAFLEPSGGLRRPRADAWRTSGAA